MRRTTVRLDDQLLAEAKAFALRNNQTLTSLIESSLRTALARPNLPRATEKFTIVVFPGGTLRPGVDLDDSASLLELMDSVAAP